jgi:hypothetical protein
LDLAVRKDAADGQGPRLSIEVDPLESKAFAYSEPQTPANKNHQAVRFGQLLNNPPNCCGVMITIGFCRLVDPLTLTNSMGLNCTGRYSHSIARSSSLEIIFTLTEDVLKSSEIEGEKLDREQVRSSIARRLGIDIGGLTPTDRNVEGVVEMSS